MQISVIRIRMFNQIQHIAVLIQLLFCASTKRDFLVLPDVSISVVYTREMKVIAQVLRRLKQQQQQQYGQG
jgi:hypothetical protein